VVGILAGRFLKAFEPIARFLPEVRPPERKVGLNEKLIWTALALVIYLIMGEIPLYGIGRGGVDPFMYLRVIFASRRGTLLELGIGPIVTAGLILQLLAGARMIECDFSNPEDRGLFTTANKAFSLIFVGVQALAYIIGGAYGALDLRSSVIIFSELFVAGMILMLLDELVQKGWGIGSGISLFIVAGVAQNLFWEIFAPLPAGDGKLYGFIPALAQTLMNGDPIISVILRAGNLPSLIGLIATVAVFMIVIYCQGVRVEIPISAARYRGFRGRYPIRLLYVSNLPVIFASSFFANIYIWSQVIWSRFNRDNSNFLLNLLGQFTVDQRGQMIPSGGLVYYVISPRSISDVAAHPLRAAVYAALMLSFCAVFSITWLQVGGLDPGTVAKQLVDAGMQIPGYRRSRRPIQSLLQRYIPPVAVLGGIIVGLIAAMSDFFGVYGTGTGILLSVSILYQYYEALMREQISEMYPALRSLLR